MSDPKVAQKSPYVLEMEPGKYAWCACGLSEKQPFCDGTHKATDINPIIEEITEKKKVAWCGCKQSGKKPMCDGSHNKL